MSILENVENDKVRERISDLFDEAQDLIDSEQVDLVVLCARRLACLYQALVENGRPELRGALVVSDRFLDSVAEWEWRNVLVLDDSVILGTTLTAVHADISARMAAAGFEPRIQCVAVCVDTQKSAAFLLERISLVPTVLKLSSEEVERFSTDVVATLFRNGVPFFSDFPPTSRLVLDANALTDFFASDKWHLVDVTAPVISTETQTAFVQLPTRETTADLLSRMDSRISQLVETFKLRSYVSRRDESNVDVTFVPIAMLAACTVEQLDAALETWAGESGDTLLLDGQWRSLSGAAKHRLLQMAVSGFVLGAAATGPLIDHLDNRTSSWIDPIFLKLYFGPRWESASELFANLQSLAVRTNPWTFEVPARVSMDVPRSSELLEDDDLRRLLWEQGELVIAVREKEDSPDPGSMTKFGLVAAHAISSVFGYVSREFEEPQQKLIHGLGSYEAYVDQFVKHPRRRVLNQTLTMRELAQTLLEDSSKPNDWGRALISLGIDIGNDLGIVVPSTQIDEERGLVYRSYRLGETAQLAETPLARWDPAEGIDALDDFLRAAASGDRVLTTNVAISLPPLKAKHAEVPGMVQDLTFLATLTNIHRIAYAGRVVGRYMGVISEVRDKEGGMFDVDLLSIDTFDEAPAEMNVRQVPPSQQGWIRPGTAVRWTVFEKDFDGFKDRTSRLRLVEPRKLDAAAIAAASSEFEFLDGAE